MLEILPELPSIQGWVEAMTSLGRLIFFDQPGTGASDPVTPGALPTLEQWADSITAVLDDLGSREAVLVAIDGALRRGAVRGDTSVPHNRAGRARGVCGCERNRTMGSTPRKPRCEVAHVGHGEIQHLVNPDMPWNEEIRATWARMERLAASPGIFALMMPLVAEMDVRAVLPTIRVPTLVVQHTDDSFIPPAMGQVRRRSHIRREVR